MKENEYDVELIDAVSLNIPLQELINIVCEKKPDFICTNVFTTNLGIVKEFIESVNLESHFILGGISTQSLYNEICNWHTENPIDIVYGDGELITPKIISNQINQEPAFEKENKRFFKVDNSSNYFVSDISDEHLDRSFFTNEPIKHLLGFSEATIVTSRGCIYNCAFCAAARSLNKKLTIREKSISSVISEIEHLKGIYSNLDSIRVLDDIFLKDANTIIKAIEIFKKFNLQWRSMAHIQSFKGAPEKAIASLKKAGCYEVFIGIESGSPKILKKIHKTTDIGLIKDNISKLLRNEINVKAYFIYGFPTESIEDFKLTYSLAEYLKEISIKYGSRFRVSVFQFRPYHGTELYYSLEKDFGKEVFTHVAAVVPNIELTHLIGRSQFNFQSGNYTDVNSEILQDFINRTMKLNSY